MLGHRLEALARQIPMGAKVADIGTDHGLIPVYLAKNNIASKVIATDISQDSLQKAKDLIIEYNLDNFIETRLGSGLQVVKPGEVDTIIIAGIGGILIKEILQQGAQVLKPETRLILQPMNAQEPLRRWLVGSGFAIPHEVLVKDGKHIYEIIVAVHGHQKVFDDIQYEIGFKLIENKDPLFKKFIEGKIGKAKDIIKGLERKNTQNAKEAMGVFLRKLEKYKEAHRWFVQ